MDKKPIRRIGILTSGGDAPGMNAVIRAVVRTASAHGISVLGIRRGYSGLINGDIVELSARSVDGIIRKGGTMLYTARCKEMMTEEGIQKAVDSCKYLGIDGLICCGGVFRRPLFLFCGLNHLDVLDLLNAVLGLVQPVNMSAVAGHEEIAHQFIGPLHIVIAVYPQLHTRLSVHHHHAVLGLNMIFLHRGARQAQRGWGNAFEMVHRGA